MLRQHVEPVSRRAFGENVAAVNLRLAMGQVDELLAHPPLPSTSTLSDAILSAAPAPACEAFLSTLRDAKLAVVSINGFPIRNFHSPRVKEQVYSPPWTDGGRALYSLKIAKVLSHLMSAAPWDLTRAPVSVPSGVFTGLYADSDEVRAQCAHFLTECARDLLRLERLTGRTVQLGLEPEPMTTGETCAQFVEYYGTILQEARQKYPLQLGVSRAQAEEIARRFITVNLDLCHQAIEFEDPVEDLKALRAAGIPVSGLHLSAALKLREPAENPRAWQALKALDEPRYLHQVVARLRSGELQRFEDLPDLWNPRRLKGRTLADFSELRCHFHVPLFADFGIDGALTSTREDVPPAVRWALANGVTDSFVVETYTWNVLASLAADGNDAARAVVGGGLDVQSGIVRELSWAREILSAHCG